MKKKEKEMFIDTVRNLEKLDWDGLIMSNASIKILLAAQQVKQESGTDSKHKMYEDMKKKG